MIIDLIVSLILAVVIALALHFGLRWRHPAAPGRMQSLGYLAAVNFAFIWAAAVWLPASGPAIKHVAVLPFLLPSCFMWLLFATLTPPRLSGSRDPAVDRAEPSLLRVRPFGPFFIVLVVGLLVFSGLGYLA